MYTEIMPNVRTPKPAPSENSAPIHEASSREIGPIGDSSDSKIGRDGDTQPTEQPWPRIKKLAAHFVPIKEIGKLILKCAYIIMLIQSVDDWFSSPRKIQLNVF